jgi:hypothetical protein
MRFATPLATICHILDAASAMLGQCRACCRTAVWKLSHSSEAARKGHIKSAYAQHALQTSQTPVIQPSSPEKRRCRINHLRKRPRKLIYCHLSHEPQDGLTATNNGSSLAARSRRSPHADTASRCPNRPDPGEVRSIQRLPLA